MNLKDEGTWHEYQRLVLNELERFNDWTKSNDVNVQNIILQQSLIQRDLTDLKNNNTEKEKELKEWRDKVDLKIAELSSKSTINEATVIAIGKYKKRLIALATAVGGVIVVPILKAYGLY